VALILYSNGIIEEFIPEGTEFTDAELIQTFEGFKTIRSMRLQEVPNTWCLWGEMDNPPPNEYNAVGSEILDIDIDSHLIMIHDSEINYDWNLIDSMIYKSYDEFKEDINEFINQSVEIIAENNKQQVNENTPMIFLAPIGQTPNKQVLFSFNPNEQSEHFFTNGGFDTFATKIYEYLNENFKSKELESETPFIIFADNKTMIMVQNEFFDTFIQKLIDVFQKKEHYEICTHIKNIKTEWYNYLKKESKKEIISNEQNKKRRGRPPKKS